MDLRKNSFGAAAYGGDGWSPRTTTHREELGTLWRDCGISDEWNRLRSVLLHRPGAELASSAEDPNAVQMLAPLDIALAQREHDDLAACCRSEGVEVIYVDPVGEPLPNQMFCADLFVMTPEGAILARPASTVRAGEERQVARRLSDLGVPILATLTGTATFEGADLMWLAPDTVMIGRGLRTNQAAIDQITDLLARQRVKVHAFDMPFGSMHFMGLFRILGPDLAIGWPRAIPHGAVELARSRNMRVIFPPDECELRQGHAFNIVTLSERRIVMAAGNPATQAFYESHGISCVTVPVGELGKASGAAGCLTGVIHRAA